MDILATACYFDMLNNQRGCKTTGPSLPPSLEPLAHHQNVAGLSLFYRYWNAGLVSSGASLTSWGEVDSLALVGHPSSDGVTIRVHYGVDVLLHRPALDPIFSYWV